MAEFYIVARVRGTRGEAGRVRSAINGCYDGVLNIAHAMVGDDRPTLADGSPAGPALDRAKRAFNAVMLKERYNTPVSCLGPGSLRVGYAGPGGRIVMWTGEHACSVDPDVAGAFAEEIMRAVSRAALYEVESRRTAMEWPPKPEVSE